MFQGRCKALVEEDGYFAALSLYIHLNPVPAGMVEDPADYPWSSFPGYARKVRQRDWVTHDAVLGGGRRRRGVRASGVRRLAGGAIPDDHWGVSLKNLCKPGLPLSGTGKSHKTWQRRRWSYPPATRSSQPETRI